MEMTPAVVSALQQQRKSAAVAWGEAQGGVGVANPLVSVPMGGAAASGAAAGGTAVVSRNPLLAGGGAGIVVTSPSRAGGTVLGAGAAAGNSSPLPTARTARCVALRVVLGLLRLYGSVAV